MRRAEKPAGMPAAAPLPKPPRKAASVPRKPGRKKRGAPAKAAAFVRPDWPAARPVWRALSRIQPHPLNPRTHPPAQVALLAELMKKHGVDQPIVVDEESVILKGAGRRLAALAAGFEEYPVVEHLGLTDAEKTAMRMADNQVALLSGWDRELVAGGIAQLKTEGYDLTLLGFGDVQLVQFTTTPGPPSQFPEVGENISVQHQCPKCGYKWSGSSAPKAAAPAKKKRGKR